MLPENSRIINLIGLKYGRLLVIDYSYNKKDIAFWKTLCDCGNEKISSGPELKRGNTKSCGCLLTINGFLRRKKKVEKIKKGETVFCHTCKVPFYKPNCFIGNKNYCSKNCHHKGMNKKVSLSCLECGCDYLVTQSFYKIRGSKYCSRKCTRIARSKAQSGCNSHLWKGGVSYEGKRIRKGVEWKMWRESVFERDKYTCQDCGAKSGKGCQVELHPHHIKQFALYPELRFDINNGITLCKECHKKTDTYMKKPKAA